ncbi:hypothetical protein M758_3G233700, partial [Ceratodon purpureus]
SLWQCVHQPNPSSHTVGTTCALNSKPNSKSSPIILDRKTSTIVINFPWPRSIKQPECQVSKLQQTQASVILPNRTPKSSHGPMIHSRTQHAAAATTAARDENAQMSPIVVRLGSAAFSLPPSFQDLIPFLRTAPVQRFSIVGNSTLHGGYIL